MEESAQASPVLDCCGHHRCGRHDRCLPAALHEHQSSLLRALALFGQARGRTPLRLHLPRLRYLRPRHLRRTRLGFRRCPDDDLRRLDWCNSWFPRRLPRRLDRRRDLTCHRHLLCSSPAARSHCLHADVQAVPQHLDGHLGLVVVRLDSDRTYYTRLGHERQERRIRDGREGNRCIALAHPALPHHPELDGTDYRLRDGCSGFLHRRRGLAVLHGYWSSHDGCVLGC